VVTEWNSHIWSLARLVATLNLRRSASWVNTPILSFGAATIEMVLESKLELCLSAEILSEFYRVAQYPKLGFTGEEIDGFIGRLLAVVVFARPTQRVNAITADPDDNRIIECAMTGKAGYIVSADQHLLRLGGYQEIKIMSTPE
jgi:putative PIN family toxin of toxin-antitoxin system